MSVSMSKACLTISVIGFLMIASVNAEIKDEHDYLECSGPTSWNDFGPYVPGTERHIRVKVERHGFARETLHVFWGASTESVTARVQYNHRDSGVWYVVDVAEPRLPFFKRGAYIHVVESYHRPWDNRWIRLYKQYIPKAPIELNPTPSDLYQYQVEAFEMQCEEVSTFDE